MRLQRVTFFPKKTAVRFALAEDRVNGEELFLVAHSQGGMLSPKIAADNPEFKGLISMGGTLRPMVDVILEQNLTMNTIDESLTPDQREAADEAIRQVVENIKSLGEEATASPDILLYGYPETYWKSLNVLDLASAMCLCWEIKSLTAASITLPPMWTRR